MIPASASFIWVKKVEYLRKPIVRDINIQIFSLNIYILRDTFLFRQFPYSCGFVDIGIFKSIFLVILVVYDLFRATACPTSSPIIAGFPAIRRHIPPHRYPNNTSLRVATRRFPSAFLPSSEPAGKDILKAV